MTERRYDEGSDRRVFTGAMQLLGSMSHRDAMSLPRDRLPVPVAARLALLLAPELLVVKKASPEGRACREKFLQTAVKTVRRWTASEAEVGLRSSLTLPIPCGRKVHQVRLEVDGTMVLRSHPGVDIALEKVSAALGASLPACIRAHPEAGAMWPPPVADDGFRLEPICAGELLAFVVLVRQWLDAGYDLWTAAPAVYVGIEPSSLVDHLALGLTLEAAIDWRFCPGADVGRWKACGFRAEDARTWQQQGRSLSALEACLVRGHEGRLLARWARLVGAGVGTEAVVEWARFGEPVGVWGEAAQRGLRAPDIKPWVAAGFESVGILRYAHLRTPLTVACAWRDEGFTAYEACGFLGVGMTLAEAVELRELPARAVQDLWPTLRSVDAVREALALV